MKEKIVVITGANSGIGKAAAITFAQAGYRVIMACRNLETSQKAQKEIIEKTSNSTVDLLKLDISSFASIREFYQEFIRKYDHLDILIHNAAYFNHGEKNYQYSADGLELTFATNLFGPYLLTELFKHLLAKSEKPTILHACTTNIRYFLDPKRKIEFDNLLGENNDQSYSVYTNYGNSKMALFMLTMKMADEYKDLGFCVNAIQIPSIKVGKETLNKLKSVYRLIGTLQNLVAPEPSVMGDLYFDICTADKYKHVTGKLINENGKIAESSHYSNGAIDSIKQFFDKNIYPKYADDETIRDQIWDMCRKVTGVDEKTI